MTFANHLLAEVEQIAHQDKRRREEKVPVQGAEPRLKRTDEGGKADGKGSREKSATCRFFLSEEGCKKGKTILDDNKRRCWTCGSTQHFSTACERPKEDGKDPGGDRTAKTGEGKGFRPVAKTARKEDGLKEELKGEDAVEDSGAPETMKNLLEEANRLLMKSMALKEKDGDDRRSEKITAMQSQLDELRKKKVLGCRGSLSSRRAMGS